MKYGYVEEGEIKAGPMPIPKTWKNISGLDKMNPAKYAALGWYEWIDIETPGETVESITVEISGTQIIRTTYKRPLTQEERLREHEAQLDFLRDRRRAAYTKEADPLFMKWQRGEGSKDAWLTMVAEIKERYPYPTFEAGGVA